MRLDLTTEQEFRPVRGSRRGEFTAWVLAVVVVLTAFLVSRNAAGIGLGTAAITAFFVLAASLVSFGNWTERKTVIRLNAEGVSFRNGLRNVRLPWDSILSVQTFPDRYGELVHVLGDRARFTYRNLGQIEWQGEVKDRLGFEDGKRIMNTIVQTAGLQARETQSGEGYYYVRA